MVEQRPASNRQVRDYSIYLDTDKLIRNVRLDLQDVNKTIRILEKRESKNKDTIKKISGYRTRVSKYWKLSDFKRGINELNRLTREYASNPTIEGARALKAAATDFENNIYRVHSLRVAQAGAVLLDPSAQSTFYSRVAVELANRQISRRHYLDGTPSILQNTAFRNKVYGYGSKGNAGPARIKVQEQDILNTPEKMEQFFTSISNPQVLRNAVAKSGTTTQGTMSHTYTAPKKVVSVWGQNRTPSTNMSVGAHSLLLGMQGGAQGGTPSSQVIPITGGTAGTPKSPASASAVISGFNGQAWATKRFLRAEARRNAYANASSFFLKHQGTMRPTFEDPQYINASSFFLKHWGTMRPTYTDPEYADASEFFKEHEDTMRNIAPVKKKEEKERKSLLKSIEILYRPLINLVKGLGDIAKEAKHMELAMSSLASALGNPFEESTLAAITDFGGAGANTALGGLGAIGGTISSVGGGIGRMANDTWGLRGKGIAGAGGGKFGGVLTAISAVMGVVGGAISAVAGIVSSGFGMANTLLKSINKISLKILSTSPLFETIKNILNLAFTMAFLPAMTLLQGKLLPIFTGLLKSMTDFGSSFATLFTRERIDLVVTAFKGIIGSIVDFFNNNNENLAEMITQMILVLPEMMKMQLGIIELFVNNKDKILNLVNKTIDVLNTFIDQGLLNELFYFMESTLNFLNKHGVEIAGAVISLAKFITGATDFVADYPKYQVMQGGMAVAKANRGDILGALGEFGKGVLSWATMGGIKLASGGYVPATPGGVPAIIGEGGEGEYVIPESKLNSIGGLTVVFSGTVYGMNDFKQQVRSIMNEYTTKANFR